ncbi:MAG TPA: gliding motility-associated C-terminal domain-containing protein, partial [Chitinophagaceae bacterium]|nr:gliding motility-associated C-terminal domain-containing protein [Chitinophagaceae bacterium]
AGSTANLQLQAVTAGSDAGLTYTYWRDAATSLPLTNPNTAPAGTYYIKATNAGGCFTIKQVTVTSNPVSAGGISPAVASSTTCRGGTITLTATPGSSYQWYKDDVLIPGATANTFKATEDGNYSVYINNGTCTGRASNTVAIKFVDCSPVPIVSDAKVFVPKAFTPNSNGANDLLRPVLYNIRQLNYFKVYNRWGQAVFQTNIIGSGWDGTIKGLKQPEETYTWILECIDKDGKVIKQSGRSLLLR